MGYGVLGKEISEIFDNLFHGIWKNVRSLSFLLHRFFFRLRMAIALRVGFGFGVSLIVDYTYFLFFFFFFSETITVMICRSAVGQLWRSLSLHYKWIIYYLVTYFVSASESLDRCGWYSVSRLFLNSTHSSGWWWWWCCFADHGHLAPLRSVVGGGKRSVQPSKRSIYSDRGFNAVLRCSGVGRLAGFYLVVVMFSVLEGGRVLCLLVLDLF